MPEKQPSYGTTPDTSFESQFKRVFEAAESKTQQELAMLLGVRQSSVSDAKRRKTIPAEWLVKLFEKNRINPEWIRMGTGPKYLKGADGEEIMPHVVKIVEVRPLLECSAQDLINELVRRAINSLDRQATCQIVANSWLPPK